MTSKIDLFVHADDREKFDRRMEESVEAGLWRHVEISREAAVCLFGSPVVGALELQAMSRQAGFEISRRTMKSHVTSS